MITDRKPLVTSLPPNYPQQVIYEKNLYSQYDPWDEENEGLLIRHYQDGDLDRRRTAIINLL